jgi:hypothetical protein
MGWTKRADALKAMDRRRSELRRGLKKTDAMNRKETWKDLFEYEALDAALARGTKDGTVKVTVGVSLNSEPMDIDPLVSYLIGFEKKLTFRRR